MSNLFNQDQKLKDKIELLKIIEWWCLPWSVTHEQAKAWIIVKSVSDLEESFIKLSAVIQNSSDSSNKLWNKLFFFKYFIRNNIYYWCFLYSIIIL